MCECCEEIEFWELLNKQTDKDMNTSHKIFSRIVVYGWREGEKRIKGKQCSTINSETYDLNYCPVCGRKLGGIINE